MASSLALPHDPSDRPHQSRRRGRAAASAFRLSLRRPAHRGPVTAALAGVGLTAALLAGLSGTAVAEPTPAAGTAPTYESVTKTLAGLGQQTEALSEKFNAATIDLTAKQKAATAANDAATKAQAAWQAALRQFGSSIVDQYKNGQLSSAGALLTSSSTQDYLDTLSDLATVTEHNSDVVDTLDVTRTAADQAKTTAAAAVAAATQVRDGLAAQQKTIEAQQAKYRSLLATLTPAQQVTFRSQGTAAVPANLTVHAGNSAAQRAIDYALAQRGKPYRYASSGPDAFDCSGLTAAAWAAAGVSLPHQSSAQYNYGTHVSLSALQPGDLVFFYSPISHVALYIGNGLIVHAPTYGDVVKVSSIFGGAVGATRLT